MDYQAEVPVLAHCCTLHFFLDRPKADLHKYNHKDALAIATWTLLLSPINRSLERCPSLECRSFGCLDLDGSACGWVTAIPSCTFSNFECTEANQRNVVSLF
jgi:hypothetical protein